MQLLRFLFFPVLLFMSQFAFATDLATARAYVDDPSGRMTLADVMYLPAKEFDGVLSRGFTKSATWIRVTVAGIPDTHPGDKLVVRIRPTYLDDIELHDPLDGTGRLRKTGDRHGWRETEFKSLNHGFVIPASNDARDIWLRLSTTSSSLIHVEVLTPDDAQLANRLQEMLYSLMLGVLLLFSLWGILQWSLRHESLVAVYAFKQLMAMVYTAFYVGYARLLFGDLLGTDRIEGFANFIFCAYSFAALCFHYSFVGEFRPARWLNGSVLLVGSVAFSVEVVLLALGEVQLAMRTNIVVVTLLPVIVLATTLSCRAWDNTGDDEAPPLPKWAVVGFYALMSAVLWWSTLSALGLRNAPELNLHLYLIHGLMTGTLLLVLLQFRALRIEHSRNQATLRARSAAQQVEIEKQKSQLQSRFMEMLAHELKTSLSVLHMVFGADKASPAMLEHGRRTVTSINDLIERCLQAEKFEDKEIISHFETFNMDALVDEVLGKSPAVGRFVVEQEAGIRVNSDWQIFKSVLSNLFDNALKYSSFGSAIRVRVQEAVRDGVRGFQLSVENDVQAGADSPAFPDEAELFKKYYRADGARKHSGSGLGLYLVANFMRLLGGSVRYERLDNSVRFTVWLPN